MQPIDLKILSERLSELTEVFQAKTVSEKGLSVWFNVLREFPTEKVCGVLIGWPKSHSKMPAPNDVWKVVNEIMIGERERKAEQDRRAAEFSPEVAGVQAKQFLKEIREKLNRPMLTPREHWERVLRTATPGSIGHYYASQALLKMGAVTVEREPGQDDEELRDAA